MTASGRRELVWLFVALSIGGCSTPKGRAPNDVPAGRLWSGRLSLDLEGESRQAFFAFFELKGSAGAGELTLSGPLGNIIATILWTAGEASLRVGEESRQFDSVESLIQEIAGTALPVGALFDWLVGIETDVGGWSPDLSRLGEGRMSARRTNPEPIANLKLILD